MLSETKNHHCSKMKLAIFSLLFGSIACHLRDKAHQIYFGCAISADNLSNDNQYKTIAAQEFNSLTGENEMKWGRIESTRGKPNYQSGDKLVEFAQKNGMKIRGHTLVWHGQVPEWVPKLNKTELEKVMKDHVRDEVTHFKGKIYAWDVINEVLGKDGKPQNVIWYNNFGTKYIPEVFKIAHETDPKAKLYINEAEVDGINTKSTALYNMAKQLLAQGVPVHGVGFQSRMVVGQVPKDYVENLKRFSDLGLDVAFTELTLQIKKPITEESRKQQTKDYVQVVDACLSVKRCVGITVWEFTDKYNWLVTRNDTNFGEACLWDVNYKPHQAVSAIEKVLR